MSMQETEKTVDFDATIGAWIAEYRLTKQMIKDLEEKLDICRAHIENAMGDAETGFLNNQPVVRWSQVTTNRFDTTRAKEMLPPQVVELLTTQTTSRRFTIVDQDNL